MSHSPANSDLNLPTLEEIEQFLNTPEAQESIRRRWKALQEELKQLDESRRITFEQLHTPMTL